MEVQAGELPGAALAELGQLQAAVEFLLSAEQSGADDVLAALQQVASSLLSMVGSAGLQPELCARCVEGLKQGLAAAHSAAAAGGSQLALMRRELWCTALLPLVDQLFHSPQWYNACQPGTEQQGGLFFVVRDSAREMIKASFLPLLMEATGQQSAAAGGFVLAEVYHAVLGLARTAANILSMQDERAACFPGMRYYGLVGVLWSGLVKLWGSVPADLRPAVEAEGLGGQALMDIIAGFLHSDLGSLAVRLEPQDAKLLLFWAQHLFRLLQSHPEAAAGAWAMMLRCCCRVHEQLGQLLSLTDERAAAVLQAIAQCQLASKSSKLLACCLSAMQAQHDLRASVDSVRSQLADCTRPSKQAQAVHTLSAVLGMLQHAAVMSPRARHACLPLLDASAGALIGPAFPAALEAAEVREEMADSLLTFMAACCSAAAQAATRDASADQEARATQQLVQQTWLRCQQQLFLLALQPHPLLSQVLGQMWADLAACSEEQLVRHHVTLLNNLLSTATAAEACAAAAAGGFAPPSDLQLQLLSLLACVLCAASERVRESYFANFLVLTDVQDSCKLAVLAAALRLAAVVDGAAGSPGASGLVASLLQQLGSTIESSVETVLPAMGRAGQAWAAEAAFWVAQLLDALHSAASYLAASSTSAEPHLPLLGGMAGHTVRLLVNSPPSASVCFTRPALGLLAALHSLSAGLLTSEHLQLLLPHLLGWARQRELATDVARLAVAYKAQAAPPHAQLFHELLTQADPLAQHASMQAYADYVRGCPPENVRSSVPAALQDPATGAPSATFLAVLRQYISRALPLDATSPSTETVAGWGPALQDSASAGMAQLLRAVDTARTAQAPAGGPPPAAAAPSVQQQLAAAQQLTAGQEDGGEEADISVAVQELVQSIKGVEAALRRAGGQAPPSDANLLRKCARRLEQLTQA